MKNLKIVICICIGIFLCGCSLTEENVGERKEQNKITMQKGRSDMKSPEPVWKNYNAYLQDYNNPESVNLASKHTRHPITPREMLVFQIAH